MWFVLKMMLRLLRLCGRARQDIVLENLVLRHQLAVLERPGRRPALRVADNGPAGQINQSTLEQSTVDIDTEFTKMIVVQRAFSAAAKIITTADEMLEELLRTKR